MTRAALSARYSFDNQREASIEDQFRLCREHAARERWQIVGLSGSKHFSSATRRGRLPAITA
ncbi:MAG: hypothetical protein AB7S92_24505 [Parvibaculaceae bacterium]